MKLKRFLIAGLLTIAAMVQAQQMPDLPMDPAVRMGKLDNGLTYYVRQNGWPENRVNFYIAQRVGSIQENDDQRGLAHFLEHMAFNGSDNFPGNDLIEFTRSIGVEFGSDLNAYTGIDQTVYRVCNVPSGRIETLDSCMLILRDWSCGLLLEADEIQKERGVIHEEWRLRTSPIMRMLERNLEALYPGSKYGQRMPIGKMEIIDNFEPQVLRDYYHKWYRPDNQAIIIVGDIDVDRTEAKIKEMFGNIKLDPNAAQVVEEQVPDNAEPIIIIDKDKEQQMTIVELMFKHDPTPKEAKTNMMYMVESYAKHMAVVMLNQRMSEKALDPECPYISASCSDGNFFLASTKESFGLDVLPKEGRTEEALAAAYREALRAAKFGFTATEYARAKEEYMSQLEKIYTNRNKRDNSVFGDACRDHYLENEPILDIETEYQMMNMLTPQLPVEMINQILPELVSTTDENLVIMCFNQEKDGATYPTKETFLNAISGVRSEQLEAYVDNVKDEPLMTKLPKKGKIKSERMVNELGYKELILSNGAKVLLKKTDYKDDQILMTA
ncbi:MAG: insulinase family protein, partial [Prevotella sp.]|nr:insulinase family protein [Prevotella sp.]